MKSTLILLVISLFYTSLRGQENVNRNDFHPRKKFNFNAGINFPFGDFASTHFLGYSTEFAVSNHRFGRFEKAPVNKLGWKVNAGCDFFFGKKEFFSTSMYKYPKYFLAYLGGGIILNPEKKIYFSINAGPALSLYNKTTRFIFRSGIEGNYSITKKLNTGVKFSMIKETISESLWSGSLLVGFAF